MSKFGVFCKFSSGIVLLLSIISSSSAATDKVLCYYQSHSSALKPEDVDVSVCTHVNYAFYGVNQDGTLRPDGNDDVMKRLGSLKKKNPNVKLILSVGGWGEPPKGFSDVAKNATKKQVMAQSALTILKKYNFDGLDIDWEYPSTRGGIPQDKENYVDMLRVLRETFDKNGGLLLTTAVWFSVDTNCYNVPEIAKYVHYINVMTYDIHHATEGKTGHNSPLYASSRDTDAEKKASSCDASITNWINAGAPAEQLTLGLAFYGYSYKLADPTKHGIDDKSTGAGTHDGSYRQICNLKQGWTEVWDDEQKIPYKYSGDQWVNFDNPKSIGLKVQYAKQKKLGGVMMWAVDLDDTDGTCGTKNALLKAIKDNL